MERDGQWYYFHADNLGSIVKITDASKNVVQSYDYDTHGMLKPSTPFRNSYTYTGREWDAETGLQYYRERYRDPLDGNFISKDPLGFAGGDTNLYRYVGGNPVSFVDPFGLSPYSGLLKQFKAENVSRLDPEIFQRSVESFLPIASIKSIRCAAKGVTAVIGRVKDLGNLSSAEKSLLDRLPDLGSPKANWKQNSGVIRQEMKRGLPIRDASPGDTGGQFLNAERNLLRERGWTFDSGTSYWRPPIP